MRDDEEEGGKAKRQGAVGCVRTLPLYSLRRTEKNAAELWYSTHKGAGNFNTYASPEDILEKYFRKPRAEELALKPEAIDSEFPEYFTPKERELYDKYNALFAEEYDKQFQARASEAAYKQDIARLWWSALWAKRLKRLLARFAGQGMTLRLSSCTELRLDDFVLTEAGAIEAVGSGAQKVLAALREEEARAKKVLAAISVKKELGSGSKIKRASEKVKTSSTSSKALPKARSRRRPKSLAGISSSELVSRQKKEIRNWLKSRSEELAFDKLLPDMADAAWQLENGSEITIGNSARRTFLKTAKRKMRRGKNPDGTPLTKNKLVVSHYNVMQRQRHTEIRFEYKAKQDDDDFVRLNSTEAQAHEAALRATEDQLHLPSPGWLPTQKINPSKSLPLIASDKTVLGLARRCGVKLKGAKGAYRKYFEEFVRLMKVGDDRAVRLAATYRLLACVAFEVDVDLPTFTASSKHKGQGSATLPRSDLQRVMLFVAKLSEEKLVERAIKAKKAPEYEQAISLRERWVRVQAIKEIGKIFQRRFEGELDQFAEQWFYEFDQNNEAA